MSDSAVTPIPERTYIYYDGWCSMCIKSVGFIQKYDKDHSILECVDFRKLDDPRLHFVNIDRESLIKTVHTLTPDGNLYAGPEAIRRAFNAVGKRHNASWTALPIIRPIFNFCYRIFARNRLKWFATHQCKDGSCKIDLQGSETDSTN